jgi:hypothetical protein
LAFRESTAHFSLRDSFAFAIFVGTSNTKMPPGMTISEGGGFAVCVIAGLESVVLPQAPSQTGITRTALALKFRNFIS